MPWDRTAEEMTLAQASLGGVYGLWWLHADTPAETVWHNTWEPVTTELYRALPFLVAGFWGCIGGCELERSFHTAQQDCIEGGGAVHFVAKCWVPREERPLR